MSGIRRLVPNAVTFALLGILFASVAASAADTAFATPAASAADTAFATPAASAADTAYGRLLARHVAPGRIGHVELNLVDYRALAADPDYAAAVADLGEARPEDLATTAQRLAFWLNAYNLLAIKTVVDRYPVRSIKDGGSFLFPIWKKKVGRVGGREYSLDEIENGILRREFAEPRIHLALVCASVSCPDLRPEPYEAARLDEQLGDQARRFLANRGKGLVPGPDRTTAKVSSIFEWFAGDFAPVGGVAKFLRGAADPETAAAIADLTDAGLGYLDYDWSLNDRARAAGHVVP